MQTEIQKHITMEDLPEFGQEIAQIVGVQDALKILEALSGQEIYFPSPQQITKPVRDKLIKDSFDGNNFKQLAKKWGLSVRWVRKIVQERKAKTCH